MKHKNKIEQRRPALKKMGLGGILAGAVVMSSGRWLKPVVETVVLPAHADTTLLLCYSVDVRVFDLVDSPGSGGNAEFKIEIRSDALDSLNQVAVIASVDNGDLVGASSGNVYTGNSLVFGWFGPAIPGIAVPSIATELSVEWVCANGETGTSTFDLVDLVLTAAVV